jgi:alcohol dehydrogenase (NADP+)
MEKLLKTGKTKAIGISNFSRGELERLLKETTVVPAAHQLELHPYLQQHEFIKYNTSKGIHITQYSPFGNQNEIYGSKLGKLIDDPTLVEIGKKYDKSGAQVALGKLSSWLVSLHIANRSQHGVLSSDTR